MVVKNLLFRLSAVVVVATMGFVTLGAMPLAQSVTNTQVIPGEGIAVLQTPLAQGVTTTQTPPTEGLIVPRTPITQTDTVPQTPLAQKVTTTRTFTVTEANLEQTLTTAQALLTQGTSVVLVSEAVIFRRETV